MEYKQEDIEKMVRMIENKRKSSKGWYQRNKERALELGKEWREKNREKVLARRKVRYQKNIEKLRAKASKYYQEVRKHYRKDNPEMKKKESQWALTRIAKLKAFIQETKVAKGGKCDKCGYNEEVKILHFHHINGMKDKLGNISEMKSLKKIREEAAKCILLCPNCHMTLHTK